MNFSVKSAGLALGLICIWSCGGGGGGVSQNSQTIRQDTFNVSPGASAKKSFGEIGIEVPAGAFPAGATLTLKQFDNPPFRPNNPNFLPTYSVELVSSAQPTNSLVVTTPDSAQAHLVALNSGQRFTWLKDALANGRLRFVLPKTGQSAAPGVNQPSTIWQATVGLIRDNLPDPELKLVHLSGSDDFGAPGTVVYIHGLFDNAQSMKRLSDILSPALGFSHCYSLAYDWRLGAGPVATYLGTLLDQVKSKGKNITLIGHSRGGVLARYVLERRGKTHAVKELVSLNAPHQGSWAATAADVAVALVVEWLNGDGLCSPLTVNLSDPCVAELRQGSSFLTDLNSPHGAQRGDVDYVLVASDRDWIVPTASGLASQANVPELTGGAIYRTTLAGASHSSVKSNAGQIAQIATAIERNNGTEAVVSSSQLEIEAVSDGWNYDLTVRNQSAAPIVIEDLSFDNYNRYGSWSGNQYFDPNTPNGEFFPTSYRSWNKSLAVGQSVALNLHTWTDTDRHRIDETAAEHQAGSIIVTVRGRASSARTFEAQAVFRLRYGAITPAPARSRRPLGTVPSPPAPVGPN